MAVELVRAFTQGSELVARRPPLVARSPDADSALPYLVRLPLGPHGVVLKVRDQWPRPAKVYCHPSEDWHDSVEVVERVPVRSCVRRGAAVDLALARGRENRSQFVFTRATTRRQALPAGDDAVESDARIVAAVERNGSWARRSPTTRRMRRPRRESWDCRQRGRWPGPRLPAAEIRAWANANGHAVSEKGRIPAAVRAAFDAAR